MKYLFKHIFFVFLFISLTSCDVVESLFTTNQFEDFSDYNPFTLVIGEITWDMLSEEQQAERIIEYIDGALSGENQDDFYKMLAEDTDYRDAVTESFRDLINETELDENSDTYTENLLSYKRTALALSRIELYSRNINAGEGLNNLYTSYLAGDIDGTITAETFISNVFLLTIDDRENKTDAEIKVQLKKDVLGSYRSGYSFKKLGSIIKNPDNPTFEIISEDEEVNIEDDAVNILMSGIINRIIDLTKYEDSTLTEDAVIDLLVNGISSSTFSSTIKFPKDVDITSGDTVLEHYLGEEVALLFTATGYELPSVSIFKGGTL